MVFAAGGLVRAFMQRVMSDLNRSSRYTRRIAVWARLALLGNRIHTASNLSPGGCHGSDTVGAISGAAGRNSRLSCPIWPPVPKGRRRTQAPRPEDAGLAEAPGGARLCGPNDPAGVRRQARSGAGYHGLPCRDRARHLPRPMLYAGLTNQGISMLVPTLLEVGTEGRRSASIFPKTIRGDLIWCQGYSEPGTATATWQMRRLRTELRDG